VIYTLRHRTTYRYGRPVRFASCSLRLRPRDGDGQVVQSSAVTITPSPASAVARRDYFGIEALGITVDVPHTEFDVEAVSRVEVSRPEPPAPESGLPWDEVRDAVVASRDLGADAPIHFLFPSTRVPLVPEVTDYARASFVAGRSAYGAANDLMHRIRTDFRFDARATNVHTPLAEAFALKAGVCQDFAHVMIAGLRGMGLPAAYVSGYLRTAPPPGQPRLRGADASHAWVAVWCGDAWRGLDPTNDLAVRDDHIIVARGRDYSDVAPIDGIVAGSGRQKLKVEVDVIPDGEEACGEPEAPALALAE